MDYESMFFISAVVTFRPAKLHMFGQQSQAKVAAPEWKSESGHQRAIINLELWGRVN